MPHTVERPGEGVPGTNRCTKGLNTRPSWRFRPQPVVGLEQRALRSTLAAIAPGPALSATSLHVRRHSSNSPSPWTALQNVSFPTVDGQSELLDVYIPRTPEPAGGFPVMVTIHGGGWRKFDKTGYGLRNASVFARDGYVVVSPNYALSAKGSPTWPLNFEDVQAAVRWVRSDAGPLGFNTNEIVAVGESAGANLAALLGTSSTQSVGDAGSSAVDAVVAVSTPTDLTRLYSESRDAGFAAAQFLGGSPDQVPANYIAASPIDHVSPGDPPMLLIHGRQDPLIPLSQSKEMRTALTAAGVRNELLVVNGGHGLDFPAHYSNLVPDVLEFLSATWKD
jgi:acetyl esterase/lipase